MSRKAIPTQKYLEIAIVLICLAMFALLYNVGTYRMVVLHLFYLPVVLAAFFLGRYRAGTFALLCAMGAAVVITLDEASLVAYNSPLATWLALAIWSAVLGLISILAGTLSDERMEKMDELHDAYVGVVEVLSRYLNSADPKANDHAARVSFLSQAVATRMGMPDKAADNIRVAALLQDLKHIEITAKVLRRAVGDLKHNNGPIMAEHTFNGSDLVFSLGNVLTGALPLLVDQNSCLNPSAAGERSSAAGDSTIGASIIRTVSRYITLLGREPCCISPRDAITALRNDFEVNHNGSIVLALERIVLNSANAIPEYAEPESVLAHAE